MAKHLKSYILCVAVITLLLMPCSRAQRPSFAGSRPPNGLNQKDKYHPQPPAITDIENRFGNTNGSIITNKIPFGQAQTPPVGYPVVLPESVYTVLIPSKPILINNTGTSVVFENRSGDPNGNITSPSSTTEQSAVPLDAHGDQLLVNQLNQIPVDKRPFWFINFRAIEAQRNGSFANAASGQGSRGSFLG